VIGVFSSVLMRALMGVWHGRPADGRPADGRGSRNIDRAERGVVAEMADGISRSTSLGKLAVDGVASASVGLRMGTGLVAMVDGEDRSVMSSQANDLMPSQIGAASQRSTCLEMLLRTARQD
jgi:hypothetical protein